MALSPVSIPTTRRGVGQSGRGLQKSRMVLNEVGMKSTLKTTILDNEYTLGGGALPLFGSTPTLGEGVEWTSPILVGGPLPLSFPFYWYRHRDNRRTQASPGGRCP